MEWMVRRLFLGGRCRSCFSGWPESSMDRLCCACQVEFEREDVGWFFLTLRHLALRHCADAGCCWRHAIE